MKKSLKQRFDDFFKISASGSSFKVEIIAGIATFLAMSYILTVNPNQILYQESKDPLWSAMFIATAFGAIIGTLLMSVYAKMPFAQAPGMGLNSALGGIIGGGVGAFSYGYSYSLANALLLVFISGLLFLFFSVVPIGKNPETGKLINLREKIYDGMPDCLRKAIPVGIGFFIAFIGLQNANIIVSNQYTIVQLVDLKEIFTGSLTKVVEFENDAGEIIKQTVLCDYTYAIVGFVSFFSIAILSRFKVKGAVIIGILIATIVAIPLGVADINILLGNSENANITWKFWESFGDYFSKDGVFLTLFKDGFKMPGGSLFTSIMIVITFCMIDMFDTMGTVVGCATNAGLLEKNGKPVNYNKIMISDSVATSVGALFGTSTVTTFVESGTGISVGGKTGFSSLITTLMFVLSLFLLPVFAFIPKAAAAGALIYVGVLMMKNVVNIDFTSVRGSCTSFFAILMMVLTYSITTGIGIGVITYVAITVVSNILFAIKNLFTKDKSKKKEIKWDISIILWIVFVLFLVYFIVPTNFN